LVAAVEGGIKIIAVSCKPRGRQFVWDLGTTQPGVQIVVNSKNRVQMLSLPAARQKLFKFYFLLLSGS
jgi:hypothetical protein